MISHNIKRASLIRGDLVEVSEWEERKDGFRLGKESRVSVLRSFNAGLEK